MADRACRFVWYELLTLDVDAAADFYGRVVGWSVAKGGVTGADYRMFHAADGPVAGLFAITPDMGGALPAWFGYVGVPDIDGYLERLVAAGGALHKPATDIPGVGRFAVVADPHGAVFALFQGADGAAAGDEPGSMQPGHVGWRELMAGDLDEAFAFYSGLFGWQKGEGMDMGEMGTYQLFGLGEDMLGGMMTRPPMVPVPYWGYYFNVPSIAEAIAAIGETGGTVVNGPMEVPGGAWIVQATDPQGAYFALVGPKE